MTIFARRTRTAAPSNTESPQDRSYRRGLIRDLTFEIVPLKSVDDAIAALPPGASVSVTCSPTKGIGTTMELTERLLAAGHRPIPHLAARLIDGPVHVKTLAGRLRDLGVDRIFLVGGDADPPVHYDNATDVLAELLSNDHGLTEIGVPSYPDGHALIDRSVLDRALHDKQQLLIDAGIDGYTSTQMCFDPTTIVDWLAAERASGLTLPVKLGLPGVVDRTRLVTMGARLGIGTSLSYLKKNRRAVSALLTSTDHDPNHLLMELSHRLAPLHVTGLHCFTFNQVAATEAWRVAATTD